MRLFAKDMNHRKLGIKVGQTFEIVKIDKVNRQKRVKKAIVKKLYPRHALCLVNGRFRECFTYNELACLVNKKNEQS